MGVNGIIHQLIPVGVKESNGKVENTHRQDDRDFYAMGSFEIYESISSNVKGSNEPWTQIPATTPGEAVYGAYAKAVALMAVIATDRNQTIYRLDQNGNFSTNKYPFPLQKSH